MCKFELIDSKTKEVVTTYNLKELYEIIKKNMLKNKKFSYYILCHYPNYKTYSIESKVFTDCVEVNNKALGKKEIVLIS